MSLVHALLRIFAYVFHFGLAAFLVGLAAVAYLSNLHNIESGGMTTLTGKDLTNTLLWIGLAGMVAVILAVLNRFRWLFPVYALFIVVTMFRWFFLSGYRFSDGNAFWWGVFLFVLAICAFLASLLELKRGRRYSHRR